MRTPIVNEKKQILMGPVMAAGPAPINLKSCNHFAIVAYSTITSTGAGTINGDVGLSPAGGIDLGSPPATVNGTIYNGGPIAEQAQLDLTDAINAASPASLPGGTDVGAELGGLVLVAGVYKSPSGAYDITSVDVTLSGGPDDVWVFQMASTLTVGSSRKVILTGGAQARNIFWQVGSSATIGTSAEFKGTVMAYASVSMLASSTLEGRALAQNGAVTFNGASGTLSTLPLFTQVIMEITTNAAVLTLLTPLSVPLTVEASPNLLSTTNWVTVYSNTPVASPWTITNEITAGEPRRFYRAFVTP